MESDCKFPLRNKTGEIIAWTVCSNKHYNALAKYTWHLDTKGYASGKIGEKLWKMHKYIMLVLENTIIPKGYCIDHMPPKNDKLDNRLHMLRIITRPQNSQSRLKRDGTLSQYIGVCPTPEGRFKAGIKIDGKSIYLGVYKDEQEAAQARDVWLLHNNPKNELMHTLNFPDRVDEMRAMIPYVKNVRKKSKYVGVEQYCKKFRATLITDKKILMRFVSQSEIECAIKYDSAVVEHGLDRKLNFPDNYPGYVPNQIIQTFKRDILNKDWCELIMTKNIDRGNPIINRKFYDALKLYTIYVKKNGYVVVRINGKEIKLHRFVMNISDPDIPIDHIDSNPLNNCIENLVISTDQENGENKSKRKNATSIYHGVCKLKNGKYQMAVRHPSSKVSYTSAHNSEKEAARVRDLVILTKLPNTRFKMNFKWTLDQIRHWKPILRK